MLERPRPTEAYIRRFRTARLIVPRMCRSLLASALRMAQPRMVTEPFDHAAPNPVFSRDLAVLIGVLAVLEGELGAGEVPQHLVVLC